MHLAFDAAARALFLWGGEPTGALAGLARTAMEATATIATPPGGAEVVDGHAVDVVDALGVLAAIPAKACAALPPSIAAWSQASKLALSLIARERFVPAIVTEGDAATLDARWRVSLAAEEDARAFAALAAAMPPAAYALAAEGEAPGHVWSADVTLRAFLDASVDELVRAAQPAPARPSRRAPAQAPRDWEERWAAALVTPGARFEPSGFGERTLARDLAAWVDPAIGHADRPRAVFRLELPMQGDAFRLSFLLQAPRDASLLVPAREVFSGARSLARLGVGLERAEACLLAALGLAGRLFAPIAEALAEAEPDHVMLEPSAAWVFLGEGAAALSGVGFGVDLPAELTASGQRRLRLRARVGGKRRGVAGGGVGASGLDLDGVVAFAWEVAIGDDVITERELAALAKHKAPLVQHKGVWVALDPKELDAIRARLGEGGGVLPAVDALRGALLGVAEVDGVDVPVVADGAFAKAIDRLRAGAPAASSSPPAALAATLRPYQARGVAWLSTLAALGVGACLADDMGLGKTIQTLAFLLRRLEQAPRDARPALLIAPTSVVGNWEREAARFAPTLRVVRHYGDGRARDAAALADGAFALVVTSYGVLRRDAALLATVDWSCVVLDEAQNIKNASSATSRAARTLRADHRFALTGTPVENRLGELWSILEFTTPGLLGPLAAFRRTFAVPVERYGDRGAAERLRKLVSPFLLRRLKTDPAVAPDLPAKNEARVVCTLTREQASLYRAVVDEALRKIADETSIARRGLILALLTALKQVCNHPAQYLGQPGPLSGRSGKLARTTEMLEEVALSGDRALVFTQYREMGDRLCAHLEAAIGERPLFLHGGVPKAARDEMVRRFQEDADGPKLFVLSLKAGGTGLNLTRASHVLHFDRWWNPAVEDQATDRAFRIGQRRNVQVHKLVCAGTVEEKIDAMLTSKRALAASVVGAGETWITELGDAELRDLFALSVDSAIADGSDDGGDDGFGVEPAPPRRRAATAKKRAAR